MPGGWRRPARRSSVEIPRWTPKSLLASRGRIAAVQEVTPEVREGFTALDHGRFEPARRSLERALEVCQPDELALVNERLAGACFALEDYEAGLEHAHRAFRLHRTAANSRRAAFTAILVANIHQNLGNESAQRGWLSRAHRLLENEGPCVEAGYLAVATSACDVPEIDELRRQTQRALEIAREFGDADLEARALADGGLALVAGGEVEEG